jgi:hypothetical protein
LLCAPTISPHAKTNLIASEQAAKLIRSNANRVQDAAQGSLEKILAAVDRYGHRPSIRMAHDVVTAVDPRDRKTGTLQRLDYFRSRYGRDSAGHKPARYYKSGDVKCQSEFVRYPDLLDQQLKTGAQVLNRGFLRLALAERGNAWTQLCRRIPANAVLILLDDVGHVNDTSHALIMACSVGEERPVVLAGPPHKGTSRDVLSYSGR